MRTFVAGYCIDHYSSVDKSLNAGYVRRVLGTAFDMRHRGFNMKITSVDIYQIAPRRSTQGLRPVILRAWTDEGIYGLGEVALAYGTGSDAAVGMLKEMAKRFLIGADPTRVEAMWQRLYRETFWAQGGGPVVYGAMSAIDEALWDIKGKALGVPIYELLGGKVRDSLRLYANGWSNRKDEHGRPWICSPDEYKRGVQMVLEAGYDALKFDPFYIHPSRRQWRPPRFPDREILDLAYERVKAVREAVGPDVDILIEVHGWLCPTAAIEIGRRFAEFHPFFYEEPVDAMNVECMLKVSRSVPIPIAAGERLYTRYGFREYIEKQVVDILQPDLGLAGGISEVKKIAAYAETYDLHVQPHHCGGPVNTAASIQLDACITNFIIQEWRPWAGEDVLSIVEEPLDVQATNGRLVVPDKPGLGVTLNEEVVKRHACIRVP